ncbi:hypothetical protein DPMN_174603 [Dreissena polymorpha]|uniref:Uncharacterized protein n=1 Tax=Dreissena polymorpha TaxID=45954 RepID=A0A9D4E6A5_DREPO|nr:hypothetical protein DPMN_174603 [Dreissena polymorpha]
MRKHKQMTGHQIAGVGQRRLFQVAPEKSNTVKGEVLIQPHAELEEKIIEVNQLSSVSKYKTPIELNGKPVEAVVCSHYVMGEKLEDLPCFKVKCYYCVKAHENWARFTEEVDEAVPLGVGMQRWRIAGGGSTKINWGMEDCTRVDINSCSSEDVSRVVLKGVPEGSTCGSETSNVSSTSNQEGAKNLIRDSPVQISDGGGISGSGESGPEISNIGVAARDFGWYKTNKINPSGDPELQEVAKDVLLEEEDAIEEHFEPVMAGEEYGILGVDADDTGGPSSWEFSI